MLALLCSRVAWALNVSPHSAARIPGTLLAQILTPIPVPHTSIPNSKFPATTSSATFSA